MADIFDLMLKEIKKEENSTKTRLCNIYRDMDDYFIQFDEMDIDLVKICGPDYEHYPWWCLNTSKRPMKRLEKRKMVNRELSDLDLVEEWFKEFSKHLDNTLKMFGGSLEAYNLACVIGGDKEFEKMLKKIKKIWNKRPKQATPPKDRSMRACPWKY